VGWLLDFILFFIIVEKFNADPFWGNFFSATVAVSFVFLASTKKTFNASDRYSVYKYIIYLCYQFCSIAFFSWLIHWVANSVTININFLLLDGNLLSKIICTPFSLVTNYVFMKILIERFSIKNKTNISDGVK